MKQILFLVLVTLSVALGANYNGLRVKYGNSQSGADKEYFYNIPRTAFEAEDAGWTQFIKPYDTKIHGLYMYCLNNFAVCPLYNQKGFVVGIQVSLPYEGFVAAGNTAALKFKIWQAPAAFGQPSQIMWTLPQIFVSEESLTSGAGQAIANGPTLQESGVWVYGPDDNLMKIPLTEEGIQEAGFKRQNCVPNQGKHYQYNMTNEMVCENFLPWFALVEDGELVGSGFQFFGKLTTPQVNREWLEDPQPYRISTLLASPFGPPCLYDFAEDYGFISLHIYYIDEPWNIKCKPEDVVIAIPSNA
ncbi:hypothetical protein O0L34_g664 [Tuta absoluta]|nr:hypothetical protein O0L34_g664 [Tuta absoluta]